MSVFGNDNTGVDTVTQLFTSGFRHLPGGFARRDQDQLSGAKILSLLGASVGGIGLDGLTGLANDLLCIVP